MTPITGDDHNTTPPHHLSTTPSPTRAYGKPCASSFSRFCVCVYHVNTLPWVFIWLYCVYLSVSFVRHQQSSANTLFCFKISSVSHIDGHGQSSTWYSGRRTSTTKKGSRSSSSCIAMVLILASSETSFLNATTSIAQHGVKLTGWCVNWSTEGVGSSGMYFLVAACSYSHVLNSVVILSLSYDNEQLQLTHILCII